MPSQHAQISMDTFRGMEKERGCAGAGERRRNLLTDQPGFSHPRHHHLPTADKQQINGLRESIIQPVDQPRNRTCFNIEHSFPVFQTHRTACPPLPATRQM
jgi:hypothetical protein